MEEERGEMHRERVRVLIVDDEPAICKALKIALERAGYEALTAQSGDSALTLLTFERVDVLLIGLRIPDTRGAGAPPVRAWRRAAHRSADPGHARRRGVRASRRHASSPASSDAVHDGRHLR